MGWEALFCLGVLVLLLIGLVGNRPPDALLLGSTVLVALAGIITPEEALAGFSNHGMLTVGALYVVAAALRETGALNRLGSLILRGAKAERAVLLRMSGTLPWLSALVNNTPIVAMFIPVISDWCRRHQVAPSRLLIPLSYLCILGGTCTLIGTSTNLVVNGLMTETCRAKPELSDTLHSMGFFELGRVGLPYAIVGIAYLVLVGHRLLPSRRHLLESVTEFSRRYLVNLQVRPDCPLVGRTVEQADLRHLPGLFLVEIARQDHAISPVPPDCVLEANDVLTFTGVVSTVIDIERIPGLAPVAGEGYEEQAAERRRRLLCEAVVSPTSPAVGKTIRDADFRALYNAAVVAVHRGQGRLAGKVGDIILRAGDTLLLQAGPHFVRANRNNPHFLMVARVDASRPVRHEKTGLSLALLVVLIVLMASGVVSIVIAALLVAGLMVVTGCISVSDARQSVDWRTLITIASAFGLARALDKSGCLAFAADFFVGVAGRWGPYAVLAGVFVTTSLTATMVGNNAAAAITFPFAVAAAGQLDANPRAFVMAVAFAASASFMSPLSYQTNLMVYGPGGYRFVDFIRAGLPLNLLLLVCATVLIPIAWPL